MEPYRLELGSKVNDNPNNTYYMITTLYDLGSVLVYNRIMLLEGIYSQLEDASPTYGNWLKQKLEGFDGKLDRMGPTFYRYHRIALAEALIKRGNDNHLFILTYLEFVKQYLGPGSTIMPFLGPAIEFVREVQDTQWTELMLELKDISSYLQRETKITTPKEISWYLQGEPKI